MPSEIEQLRKMKVGEEALVGSLFPGLGTEQVHAKLVRADPKVKEYQLTYLGVAIGAAVIKTLPSGKYFVRAE